MASAKRRPVWERACVVLILVLLGIPASTRKKVVSPGEPASQADQQSFQKVGQTIQQPQQLQQPQKIERRSDRDDPRARAAYLAKMRGGGRPVPRGARLNAMREQQRMMLEEGKAYWDQQASKPGAKTESSGTLPETSRAAPERHSQPPAASASQWVFIGPQPTNPSPTDLGAGNHFSGRVTALAVDPGDASGQTVYLGAAQGGVWKTTNGGATWNALTDNQDSLAIGSIVIDPQMNGQGFHTVWVGTGEENFGSDNYYGVGILRSTDGGATWSNVAGSTAFSGIAEPECTGTTQGIGGGCGGLRIGSLAASIQTINGTPTTVLLAAVEAAFTNDGGLYRSMDGGQTWNLVSGIINEGTGNRYTADSVVFASSLVAFAGIHTHPVNAPAIQQGVYRSTDGGQTWSQVNSGITVTGTGRVTVAAALSDGGNTIYAAFEDDNTSNLSGLYKTTSGLAALPGNVTWSRLNVVDFCGTQNGQSSSQCFYDMMVTVSPVNANVLFVGGAGFPLTQFVLHSTDGGASFIDDSVNIHADQHAGAFTADGNTFYIGNDGGAYKTASIGASQVAWTELNSTLGITQFYGYFAIAPNNSQSTYGGTQDNGTQQFVNDMAWNEVACGDGAGAVIDSHTGRVFTNCDFIEVNESDTGAPGSFNSADFGINQNDTVAFIPPMIGDTLNPQHLYFGTDKIYSAVSASSPAWSAISSAVTNGGAITNMDVSADGTTMYSVSEDGAVFQGTNLLTTPTFTDVTRGGFPSGASFMSGNYITAVRISPADNNTAYVSLSGFSQAPASPPYAHVFKSSGGPWVNISSNLPNTPVNDLVIDPDLPSTIYAATDIGVFVSSNDGASWSTLQQGTLPKIAVLGLRLHRGARILRAATHGRGMWDLSVPTCDRNAGPCLTLSQASVNFGNQQVGTSSSRSVTVTNTGNQPLTINGITMNGINTTGIDYGYASNCGTLAANATCTINFVFSPQAGLGRNGSATIYWSGGNPVIVELTGTGLVVPANDAIATPITITSLPFSATIITNGATSEANDPLPPQNCVTSYNPPDSLGYATSPAFNHHSIWFSYTPQTSGVLTMDTFQSTGIDTVISVWTGSPGAFSSVTCNDDARGTVQSEIGSLNATAGTTYKIMVTGYYANDSGAIVFNMSNPGVATSSPFALSAASLNFTALLGRPEAQTLTITNNSGSPQTFTSIAAVGADYFFSNDCPATLNVGAFCTVRVTLISSSVGQRNGVLNIQDSAAGSPQTVPLNGFAFDFALNNPRPHRDSRNGGIVQGQLREFQVALNTATGGQTIPVTLTCGDVPPSATCTVSPAQVVAGDGSTPVILALQTSAQRAASTGGARTRRLGGGTPVGDYNLKVVARVGDAETTTLVPVTVVAPSRSSRLGH